MVPFRDDLWNLPEWMYAVHWVVVILCGALLVVGLWRRVRLWREGRPVRAEAIRIPSWISRPSLSSRTRLIRKML